MRISQSSQFLLRGFTLVEVIVVMAMALVAYLFFFRVITLFLQTKGMSEVNQDILSTSDQIINRFTKSTQGAKNLAVSSNSYDLLVTGNPCVLIRYNPGTQRVGYAESTASACQPPSSTTIDLNSSPVSITSFAFTPISSASSAKAVQMTFTIASSRPFASRSANFSSSITLWRQ